jgi:predicted ribosomally synthesized peptide with SipW-like signal peptide
MKINKKILVSLVLVGILSMAAGVGTYSAFTAKVKSENNRIETATYTINNKFGEQSFDLFTLSNAIPGSTAEVRGFEAKVTGSKNMNITPGLELIVSKRAVNDGVLADRANAIEADLYQNEANHFEINTEVKFGEHYTFNSAKQFVSLKSFMDTINDMGLKTLSKDQVFSVSNGQIRINSAAGNDYQGATVEAELTLTAADLVQLQ